MLLTSQFGNSFDDTHQFSGSILTSGSLLIDDNNTIREFVELAFKEVDIDIIWEGEGINEVGIDSKTNKNLVEINSKYFRPTEVETLLGDPSLAKKELGWESKFTLEQLVHEMVQSDYKKVKKKGF